MSSEVQVAPRIPDYELVRLIGSGSYGDVWLARGVTGVFRAVKIVWRARFNDPRPYAREFEGVTSFAAVSLREPSQLALLHAGRNDEAGFFYYVMELADDVTRGRDIDPATYVPLTLREIRDRRERLPVDEAIALGVALARALASLHATGLVHRDIKPSNIVLVGGVPKLADVGLVAAASAGLTFVGTEGFVPPEGPGAPAADVFSLGKVLYELAMGLDRQDFPRLPPGLTDWPDRRALLELNEVLLRACEPMAANRFPHAAGLLDELLLLQAGKSVRRLRNAERRTARALRIAAVLALIAGVAGIGAYVERRRANEELVLRQKAEADRDDDRRKSVYSATLARAQRAIEVGNHGSARLNLLMARPRAGERDLRNFEWRALWHEASGDPSDVFSEQGTAKQRLTVSPDARLLAAESFGEKVPIWDIPTGQAIKVVDGPFRLAGFSADNASLLGSDAAYRMRAWSIASGVASPTPNAAFNEIVGRSGAAGVVSIETVNHAPDALTVTELLNRREGSETRSPLTSPTAWEYNHSSEVAPDGRVAAINFVLRYPGRARWLLKIYTLPDLRVVREREYPFRISATAFSADGRTLALAFSTVNEIIVEDTMSGEVRWRGVFESNMIRALAFSPDGNTLAIGGTNAVIQLVSAATGQPVRSLHGQLGGVLSIAWSRAGLFSAGTGGDVRRWRDPLRPAPTRAAFLKVEPAPLQYRAVVVSDDGSRFAVRDGAENVVVAATSLRPDQEPMRLPATVPLGFDASGNQLLTLNLAGVVQRWTLGASPQAQTEFALALDQVNAVAGSLSADLRKLAATDARGELQFWDVAQRQLLGKPAKTISGHVWWTAMSPDGQRAVTFGPEHLIKVWSVTPVALLRTWEEKNPTYRATFSANGRWLALGNLNGELAICDLANFTVARQSLKESSNIEAVAFSPDSQRLYCGDGNGIVHVFDTSDWREVTTLDATAADAKGDPTIVALATDAGGAVLAAHRQDGVVRLWQARD